MVLTAMELSQIIQGNCREVLKTLPPESVHCCVTSPPYFGLRSYQGGEKEIGLEETPAEYVAALVEVFREVKRVLRKDGTLFLNLGDSFGPGKQLLMIPHRVALALQSDGWVVRMDCVWSKTNPMPESVTDRPTKSHEYIFLLAKSPTYYYDAAAIREPSVDPPGKGRGGSLFNASPNGDPFVSALCHTGPPPVSNGWRNKRSVWSLSNQPLSMAHFAAFPEKLVEPCVLAGCPEGGTVLDPFAGSGTTLRVATRFNRQSIGIELNPEYLNFIKTRTDKVQAKMELVG